MSRDQLSKNIAAYRKKKGFSQEKLAEQMQVSRQAVTKWEKGLSKPSSNNLYRLAELFEIRVEELLGSDDFGLKSDRFFDKKNWIYVGISACCIIIYSVLCLLKKDFSVSLFILLFVLFVPIQLFFQLYFSNAVKNDSFEGIAGFDSKTDYDLDEVKKLLVKINLHIQMISSVFIFLFCIIDVLDLKWLGLNQFLVLFYIIEFITVILFYNYQGIEKLYRKEADKRKAKYTFPVLLLYLFSCLCGILVMLAAFYVKGIENNTLAAMKAAGILLTGLLVSTIGFFIMNKQIKKQNLPEAELKHSKAGILCLLGSFLIYGLTFLI